VGGGSNVSGAYNLKVKVCDSTKGLDPICNTANSKPEGILQKYQDQMRFGLISYAMRSNTDSTRDGGVIRSNVKWIQPTIAYNVKYNDYDSPNNGAVATCTTTGGCTNPEAELNTDGTFVATPNGGGVIKYINKFGYANGYKSLDPISEMYYEIVRYFKNLGPSTDNYCNSIGTSDDGFPAFCDSNTWDKTAHPYGWRDPYVYPCSQSAVIGVQDANPWLDKRIPGTAFTGPYGGSYSDYGVPGNADTSINVLNWTNNVGNYEGLTPGWLNVGCVFDGTNACSSIDSGTQKYVTELGRVVGTAPWAGKENSYYIAGLAYYAHMTNLRTDISGNHTLTSYFIDTQEPNNNMLVGKMNMLYLAAKYGGFTDTDGNGRPYTDNTCGTASPNAKCAEWDSTGTGLPDNYMFASNPSQVSVGLNRAFSDILRRLSSGTAASILNNSQGSGANLLQAVFYPLKTFDGNTQASWVGELQNLWYYIDPYFSLSTVREDTVSDKKLNLIDDYVANFYFDTTQNQTLISRSKDTDGKGNYASIDTIPPDSVNSLWKAGKILQGTSASSRTIKTVIGGSMIDFTTANASNATLQSYLQASSTSEASSIIDYVRGTDYPRPGYSTDPVYRGRTVTYQGTSDVWKLGDIVSSTPKIESTISLNTYGLPSPSGYNDLSYNSYVKSYNYGTRGTTYVGGNDGMLHAFKLGILDVRLSSTRGSSKARLVGSNLGTEQWAFIPKNALPYLRYLADPGYGHIYYVDGTPLVVDASMNKVTGCTGNYWDCPKQTTYQLDTDNNVVMGDTGIPLDPTKSPTDGSLHHPGDFVQMPQLDTAKTSWRTILIGSMGLGGASRDSSDSCGAGTFTSTCVKTPISGLGYSSYFALDVSNPSSPSFMWEFAGDPATGRYLGYSTSGPAIIRVGSKTGNGRWFAIFASGPMGPIDTGSKQFIGTSSQNLLLFVVDLATGSLVRTIDTTVTNAFAGSINSGVIDTDRGNAAAVGNYQDDAIYIGYTQEDTGTNTWTKGGVLRLLTHQDTNPDNWTYSTLISNIGPVTTSVSKLQDRKKNNLWIYFGTGRYFYKSATQPDDPGSQQALFGVKDPCYSRNTGPPNYSPLGPVNGIDTDCTDSISGVGSLTNQTGSASTDPSNTISASSPGWYINLDCTGTSCSGSPLNDGYMSERVVTDPLASTNGTVYFTTFRPTADICGFGGNTYLWAVKYDTGGVPLQNTMQGKVLVQVSTGAFAEICMATAFGGQANKGHNYRRIANPIQGVPPKAQGVSLLTNPKPIKKILHIQEK
jgi:type IV pilus assembly protein PilY1